MESQDMFTYTQKMSQGTETPSSRSPRTSTPSQSPARSVRLQPKSRLSSSVQPNLDHATRNGSVAWNVISKSLPYNLRRFSSRKDTTEDDIALWRQYGIEPSRKQANLIMDGTGVDNRIIKVNKGAFFYDYFITGSFAVEEPKSIIDAHSVHVELCRSWQEDERIHYLENSVIHLANKLHDIRSQINQESRSDVIAQPSKSVIEELFTDEPDLAAAGNFGTVLATPDTHTYTYPIIHSFFFNMFKVPLETPHRPSHTTIQGLIKDVGDCWAFSGEQGRLVLALHQPSELVRVSLSHIPSTLSVTGATDSAPRHFLVLAHHSKEDFDSGLLLGDFEYVREGPWRQVFTLNPLVMKEQLFNIVEFRFLSNSGNPSYTCIYRVHVHGRMYF